MLQLMSERFPSDATARLVVRCGEDLRDRINALAKANGRSANAEAIKALETWVDLAEHGQQVAENIRSDQPEPAQVVGTIYLAVDAQGPIAWREVKEHIDAITEAGGFDVVEMRVTVVTPEHAANDKRKAEAAALVERYRELASAKAESRE